VSQFSNQQEAGSFTGAPDEYTASIFRVGEESKQATSKKGVSEEHTDSIFRVKELAKQVTSKKKAASLMFRSKILSPSSGLKSKLSKKPGRSR
jgi:hypothetical protein